jgi:(p)ppGpp synthase/HD superfamily hydrolase
MSQLLHNPTLMNADLVSRAIYVATLAHSGVVDKCGVPYIFHPLRVGLAAQAMGLDEDYQATGILHDVVEDTYVTLEDLRQYFPENIVVAVDSLTRRNGLRAVNGREETYKEFVQRCTLNPIGRKIKPLDNADNMRPERFVVGPDFKLPRRYAKSTEIIYDALIKNGEGDYIQKFKAYHTWI